MSHVHLKVKIKSLTQEAKIIRFEERRNHGKSVSDELKSHRKFEVAREARASLVAYAFIRGRTYDSVELGARWRRQPYDRPGPRWDKVLHMVTKYGCQSSALKEVKFYSSKQYNKESAELIKRWVGEEISFQ